MNTATRWALLGLGALGLLLAGLMIGDVPLSGPDYALALTQPDSFSGQILWQIRLPRNLTALLVGAMLGLAGALMQGLLRNPLAEPGLLGVSSGAGLGAALAITFGFGLVPFAVAGASLVMACVSALILMVFAARFPQSHALILLGVGINSLMGALMALVFNLAPSPVTLAEILSWTMGAVENRSYEDVGICAAGLGVSALLIPLSGRGLKALSLGEDTAQSLGIDLKRLNFVVLLVTSLLTGLSVAIAGVIGFVGLAAPHAVRALGIRDPAALLWPSAVTGALMVLAADILLRLIPVSGELRLGVITSLIGAPLFALLAQKASRSWSMAGTGGSQ
jgi:iron complex transport system permease protein